MTLKAASLDSGYGRDGGYLSRFVSKFEPICTAAREKIHIPLKQYDNVEWCVVHPWRRGHMTLFRFRFDFVLAD